jgi:hypothetical protein
MFRCERCGSSYSAMHAAAIESCPRCRIRDGIESPLSFSPLEIPESMRTKPRFKAAPRRLPLDGPRSLPMTAASPGVDAELDQAPNETV